ncbi:diacylglycerol kinase family protein [Anatilimnocola floriformis]|uniref:diacylglycerol kinase family protein n=1 Tax=Anatilimnocola floriformis TaxID=2948575 RepID=UPI0020C484E1|nr:diacylglycerol kinase family protein [Anatilimnocola floriformis]
MNVSKFLRSFRIGATGFFHALHREQNMRLHLVAAIGVLAAAVYFQLATWEWAAVVGCVGTVIALECFNTALECLADRITREQDPLIGQAKDCSSAAVLVAAMTAAVIGGLIFVPKVLVRLGW